jgi:hypothetical protein
LIYSSKEALLFLYGTKFEVCVVLPSILGVLRVKVTCMINTLNAELNAICHLLALLGAHNILHVGRIRVKLSGCYKLDSVWQ